MRVKALWYGGTNYANPDPDRDLEAFDSIRLAASVFAGRACDPYTPCVDEEPPDQGGPEMHLYIGEYSENGPDRIITFGPRGGIRIARS